MIELAYMAQKAYDAQDACNLSGVVISFAEAIKSLRKLFPKEGTDFFNKHPICILYADKIAHLTGMQLNSADVLMQAYEEILKLRKLEV